MGNKKTAAKVNEEGQHAGAILFELENIGVDGRDVMYGVVEKAFESKGIEIKPFVFSRYALNVSLTQFVNDILEINKNRSDASKIVAEINEKVAKAILKNVSNVNNDLKKLIKQAGEKGVIVGALSSLDNASAKDLLSKLNLGIDEQNLLCSHNSERCCHSADAWLKLAKNTGVQPSMCIVLSTCRVSCKSALKAGMRCVVIPDKYTAYQDFGGSDIVADSLGGDVTAKIFQLLEDE